MSNIIDEFWNPDDTRKVLLKPVFFSRTAGIAVDDGVVCFGVDAGLAKLESSRLFSAMSAMRAADLRPGLCSEPLGKITPYDQTVRYRLCFHALNLAINVMNEEEMKRQNHQK